MAFHHFHKYSKHYLIFASVAMLFSLFVFSIPTALTAFTGHQSGKGDQPWLRFKLADSRDPIDPQKVTPGEEVELTLLEWETLKREIGGFLRAYPMSPAAEPEHAALVHAVALAEAERMGVEIPPEIVQQNYEQFLDWVKMRMGGLTSLTLKDLRTYYSRTGIDDTTFRRRLTEALKVQFYAQCVRGISIYDPSDVERYFVNRAEEVTLEYVEFPFAGYEDEARSALPEQAELETYYADISDFQLDDEFMNPDRFVLDLALLDSENFDLEALSQDARGETADPTDAELLAQYRGDPERYGSAENVESAADIPEEAHQKILRDRRLKPVLQKLRKDYEEAAAVLEAAAKPVEESTDSENSDEESSADPAESSANQKTPEELNEEQRALLERLATERGFEFSRTQSTREELATLDPPGDDNLEFLLSSWSKPGTILAVEASREKRYAYIVRLYERQRRARKPFEEVRSKVEDRWVGEKAKDLALEKARALRKSIRGQSLAEHSGQAATIQAIEAEERAKFEADESLPDAMKKSALERLDEQFFDYYLAVVGSDEGAVFDRETAAAGLEKKKVGPHRRTIQSTPHFRSRFAGAERFLFQQYSAFSRSPQLLGYVEGCVGNLMIDQENKVAYIAKVVGRQPPSLQEMTPRDRLNAESDSRRVESVRSRVGYLHPFSIQNLQRHHRPQIRVLPKSDQNASREEPYDVSVVPAAEGRSGTGS